MFIAGRITQFVLLATTAILAYLVVLWIRKGHEVKIRKLAGLEALNEVVGRATEMARPIAMTCGALGSLYESERGPQFLAALSILSHVTRLCARNRCVVNFFPIDPTLIPLAEDLMRTEYIAEGKENEFNPDEQIRWFSSSQMSYCAAMVGMIKREKVAGFLLLGPLYAESIIMAENAASVGAIQVAGTAMIPQLPFMAAICDYLLIGEELFVAGATISKGPMQMACIAAEDYVKGGIIGLIVIGVVFAMARSTWFTQLLRL